MASGETLRIISHQKVVLSSGYIKIMTFCLGVNNKTDLVGFDFVFDFLMDMVIVKEFLKHNLL